MPLGQGTDGTGPEVIRAGSSGQLSEPKGEGVWLNDPWEVLCIVLTFLMSDSAVPDRPHGVRTREQASLGERL